ncbi:Nmd2p [Sugiyamaella lignohabitans]|uniref:Nmd2p n=1 Tax=Sugiyamaella lignohabitans TaxID=796027 RepID=A0A167FCQ0_9ASCO|nr:Nmd2p [Sugiyamaella lignohabitans]ANB15125.1 Nmd2p [Sugiyamaella lignohabitans]
MTEASDASASQAPPSVSSVRNARRKELRDLNSEVWDGAQDVFPTAKNLDSTLRKNTAFIKKCRVNLAEDSQAALLNDVRTVSLEKYLSEIIGAICEGFTKAKSSADIFAGVEVASALHQRFSTQISPQLLAFFFQGISNPSKSHLDSLAPDARLREDQSRIDRHKIVLRVLIELWLVNVFRFTSDVTQAGLEVPQWALRRTENGVTMPPPLSALQEVLNHDMVDFSGASIAVVILKNYGQTLAGVSKPKAGPEASGMVEATKAVTTEKSPLVMPDIQQLFLSTFKNYTKSMQSKLQELAQQARKMEKQNGDAYIRTGKILDDRRAGLENLLSKFQSLHDLCTTLSEYLGMTMPEYKVSNETQDEVMISLANALDGDDAGLWDDSEQKKFYEDLVDLTYLANTDENENDQKEEGNSTEGNGAKSEDSDLDSSNRSTNDELDEKDKQLMNELDDIMSASQKTGNLNDNEIENSGDDPEFEDFAGEQNGEDVSGGEPTAGTRISELLTSLSTQQSRSNVDNMAIEFVALNNKATQNRVLNFLKSVPVTDQYKLPFYARFIATLDPFCKPISTGVIEYLDSFFRYLQRHRKVRALTSRRMFIIRYLGELIKFGIVPKHVIFHKLKIMIAHLDAVNVENIFTMFECCGRYLIRKPDTHALMSKMMQVLEFQKDKKFFPAEIKAMINGAIYYVNPPPKVTFQKERPVIELYIRKLIYYDLSKETSSAVLIQLKKMDWNDKDTFNSLRKVFTKIWKVKYVNIPYMAWFLASVTSSYRSFVVIIVDSLLENIRRGLETNDFEFNQKRISEVRFLGELSKYRLAPEDVIYDVLFMLISFGHPNGRPRPGQFVSLDPPNEFFRIRLVCTLLESNGVYSRINKDTTKFDLLVKFFQYYIFSKDPMSMDIEFQVRDTFELLGVKFAGSIEEASNELQHALNVYNGIEAKESTVTSSDSRSTNAPDLDEQAEADLAAELLAVTEGHSRDNYEIVKPAKPEEPIETEEERLIREEQQRIKNLEAKRINDAKADIKAMAQVEREFQKLMIDRMDRKADEKTTVFDAPVPSIKDSYDNKPSPSVTSNGSSVGYKLLTKRVGKPQIVDVNVPADSKFAVNVVTEKSRLRNEQEKIRDFVLNYEYDQNNEPRLRRVIQPEVQSTRYSGLKRPTKHAPTLDDVKF